MVYCQAFGGYLAEVDDNDEFNKLQQFFLNSSPVDLVLIAGSDELKEETWKFQRTGVALPFKSWAPKEPNNKEGKEHCLCLDRGKGGEMNDITCSFVRIARFMCELPDST
uniref:C-type lectin domain-containing protein n=1 Tax=Biomphalaria glabrata TaxID=6526 RepID=A0A2C9KNS5_BIOGL